MTDNIEFNYETEISNSTESMYNSVPQLFTVDRGSATIKFLEKWRDLCCSNEDRSNPDVVYRLHLKMPRKLRKKLKREGNEVPRTITINESIEDFQSRLFKGIYERPE